MANFPAAVKQALHAFLSVCLLFQLPLSLFHVKAKAGFQLGSFNQLPRRTVWSYEKDGIQPPNIDLSGNHVVRRQPINKTDLLRELEGKGVI